MRFLGVLSVAACALALAGCMDGKTETVTVTETVTDTATSSVPEEAPAQVVLYFLEDGKVAPEVRGIVAGQAIGTATINELLKGPESDLTTSIPSETKLQSLSIDNGVASIDLDPTLDSTAARSEIVYTLTQFSTVKRVSFNRGRPVARATFENQTPAIFVESPLPGEDVEPGFAVTGTANTFEATFNYELRDATDKVLAKNFVTATSGSGTRGTFRFTVPYEVARPQDGRLVVFELSAADGSRINERSTPLKLR
jgi:hypothetical protein